MSALARLQQFSTAVLLLFSLAWAASAWRLGHPLWMPGGALLLFAGYAAVLAGELLLMLRCTAGQGSAATPSATQLLGAWWHEACAGPRVFCWQQPFQSQRWPDRLTRSGRAQSAKHEGNHEVDHEADHEAHREAHREERPVVGHGAGRGVVLIHGFVCNRGVWNPWLARLQAQGTPVVAVNLEPVFGSIDDYAAAIDQAVLRLFAATGKAPVVVAHSMGGLAFRGWWAQQSDSRLVHHAITIASPHHGTWLARWAFSQNGRQMRQGSAWLLNLAQREVERALPLRRGRMTCFFGHCDNVVFPAETATLLGADNRHLPGVAHVEMLERPEPWLELQHRLMS